MASNIGNKRTITRQRDHLSCVECRRKKLKCDRTLPCSTCVKRDGGMTCTYQRSTTGFEAERERRRKAEGRLEHLEQLVQQLSKSGQRQEPPVNGPESSSATDLPVNGTPGQDGRLVRDINTGLGPVYSGATHWSAMLDDIEELRSAISMPMSGPDSTGQVPSNAASQSTDDSSILFGAGPTLTFEQVLTQYLPPRQEADRLVANYFRSKAVKAPFLHHSHFQRLYLVFWTTPFASPPLLVSMIFSVLHASVTSLGLPVVADNRYAVAAAQCLVIGKHYQPKQYAVEALFLYAQTKCFTQLDITADIGNVFSMATRTALRMGYHRDPGRLSISPFEQEMRRRTWSTLLQVELLIAFQLGLPSSILPGCHDTKIPANLQDADFGEDTAEMPPSRPETEETDIMFYIAKHRISMAFEKVLQHVSATSSINAYSEFAIEALDAEIRQTFLALPEQYRAQSVSASVFDSPTLIVARFCVNMMYEKSLCVLHRPYVAAGRRESVLACYTASSNIIRQFVDAYDEFRAGGQMEYQRWFMSAITWHDFLLGATALALVMCSACRHDMLSAIDLSEAIVLLERAGDVLAKHAAESRDTLQVERVVRMVHARVVNAAASSDGLGIASRMPGMSFSGANDAASLPTPSNGIEGDMGLGWTANLWEPMVDESWNWLESFLQQDASAFANGNSMSIP